MPKKRVESKRRNKKNIVAAWQWHLLCFGKLPEDTGEANCFEVMEFEHGGSGEEWEACRAELLQQWIKERPGTRPWAWWHFDAPRWCDSRFEGLFYQGKIQKPRERLGGTGTPSFECLNSAPSIEWGVPDSWVEAQQADYYNGRCENIHGEPIGTEYEEGHFEGLPVDPDDPPVYETEASYLKRHGLLTEEEKRLDLDYTGHVSVVDLAFLSTDGLRKNKEFFLQHPKKQK